MSELQKNVIVTLDTSQAQQNVDALKGKVDNLNNSKVDKPLATLKQQLKEANNEAQRMFQQFGAGSEEFKKAATRVADLKNQMDEVNLSFKNFNPDNKLQSLVTISKGATGALQGVTGAMAFLGVESEKSSETIAKLQGLMAFSDALNSIGDMKDSFKNLGSILGFTKQSAEAASTGMTGTATATKGATVATTGLGTAFKALGIGLIVSAIAYLVDNWDSLKESVMKLIPGLGQAGEAFNKVKAIAFGVGNVILKYVSGPIKAIIQAITGDFKGALGTVKGMLDVTKNFNEGYNNEIKSQNEEAAKERLKQTVKDTEDQIKVLKARGKDTYATERENLNRKISLEKQGSEEYKKALNERDVLDATHQKKVEDDANAALEKRKQAAEKARAQREAEQKKLEDLLKAEREKLQQHHDQVLQITEGAQRELALSKLTDKDKEIQQLQNDFADKTKELEKLHKEDVAMLDRQLKDKQLTQQQYNQRVTELNLKYGDASVALAENKGEKELAVTQKYNKLISDFINSYQLSELDKQKQKIIGDFDEKIKVADEKQRELLEKLKQQQLEKLDAESNANTNVTNAQTNLITTQVENKITDSDSPEERKNKLANLYAAQTEVENAEFEKKKLAAAGNQAELERLEAEHKQKLTDIAGEQAEAEKEIDDAKKEAKIANMQAVGNALNTFSDIVGKQTVAGKAMAVAAATIDTYQGVTKALGAYPPPFNFVAAAAVGAAGLMNIKKIVSTKVPGKSDGSSAPPVINQAPQINATQLQPQQVQEMRVTNFQDQKPQRAYIVDRDLQNNQKKTEFLNNLGTWN